MLQAIEALVGRHVSSGERVREPRVKRLALRRHVSSARLACDCGAHCRQVVKGHAAGDDEDALVAQSHVRRGGQAAEQ
jgi:hypothetical protein